MRAPDSIFPPLSRRAFLRIGAASGGGLLIGFVLPGCDRERRNERPPESAVGTATQRATDQPPGFEPNAFIRIDPQGVVTLVMHKVEMGQGTFTSIPMLLAEELAVDLSKVRLEQAPADNARYADTLLGGQVTGGSTSVRANWKPLRDAGATARMVLVRAAADRWDADVEDCVAEDGAVRHEASGRRLHYGELVDDAAKLDPPAEITLKPASEFRLIGKSHSRLDSSSKVDGSAQFGIDVRLPGMRVATVAASPVPGGALKSVDEAAARAVRGVDEILRLRNAVAVVGEHMWAARQGLAALAPTWEDGPHASLTTASLVAEMHAASRKDGAVARDTGDARAVLADAQRKVEAIYEMPFLAHATMEPMNCTVDLRADGCDLWVGTQVPALAQGATAQLTGLPLERVRVHNQYLGGGFGRRLEVDFIVQSVAFAQQAKGPIKFVWTREEDIQHDMYRPYYVDRISAALDEDGRPNAWFHRVTGSSIMARFAPGQVKDGVDPDAVEGARDLPYAIPAVRVEYRRHEPPIATAFWRGVGPTHNVWVVESFIDECAHAARQDPVAYRRALLDESPRTRAVLELAAQKCGWGTPLSARPGERAGRGVSAQFAFGSYLAQAAEVAVADDGSVRVLRVVCAVDCGQVVNPDGVVAQIQSGIVFGLSAALWQQITLARGRVQQSNFGDYRVMRINEAPKIEVYLVPSTDDPGGIGEPGTSAIAPALTNAIFAATGKRLRKLPVEAGLLKA